LRRLGGEKESGAMLGHPATHPQFRVTVIGGGVDVVDAVFEQKFENSVRSILAHSPERGCSKEDASTAVAGSAERAFLEHA
jgi:hypothetical protein